MDCKYLTSTTCPIHVGAKARGEIMYERTADWWGARCGEVFFMSAAGIGIHFGFVDYVVCYLLYCIWLRVSAGVDAMKGIRDALTVDPAAVARDIVMRLARSRAGHGDSVDSHRGG